MLDYMLGAAAAILLIFGASNAFADHSPVREVAEGKWVRGSFIACDTPEQISRLLIVLKEEGFEESKKVWAHFNSQKGMVPGSNACGILKDGAFMITSVIWTGQAETAGNHEVPVVVAEIAAATGPTTLIPIPQHTILFNTKLAPSI